MAILDEIKLMDGMSCLDVGCGPGEVMRLMAQRVGRTGSVTGVDTDGKVGREALGVLRSTGDANFEFVEGDFQKLDYFSDKRYDLVYSRFLLIHLRDPISALKRMYECTKPGGCLVIQDYDFRTLDEYPPTDSMEELRRVFLGVMEGSGADTRIGYKLPNHFIRAGIGAPDGVRVDGGMTVHNESDMGRATYKSVLPAALKLGLTTEEKYKGYLERLDGLEDKASHFVFWPLCVGVWKMKPS